VSCGRVGRRRCLRLWETVGPSIVGEDFAERSTWLAVKGLDEEYLKKTFAPSVGLVK
jgi:hypothetical protein